MFVKIRENEEITDEGDIKIELALKPSEGIDRTFETKLDEHEPKSELRRSAKWRFRIIEKEDNNQWNRLIFQELQWNLYLKSLTS